MMCRILILVLLLSIFAGCATPGTRDRPFTGDWADHVRGTPGRDRRSPQTSETEETRQIGPATVTRDESGRPQLVVGGQTGLGADVDYRGGPSGRVRYRRQWDFARPERR